MKTLSALLLVLAVTLDFTAAAAAADPPRKANTILSNPVVWKSNDLRELVRGGGLSSTDIAALSGGRQELPWGIQASNKCMQALRGTSAGESELTVVSLCKAKGLTSKPATVTVLIVVQPAT